MLFNETHYCIMYSAAAGTRLLNSEYEHRVNIAAVRIHYNYNDTKRH